MRVDWSANPVEPLVIDGQQLEYACHGPAPDAAPTIVLLHEGLGCVSRWKDFPDRLARATGMGVFTYSRLGHGQSDPAVLPKPLDMSEREAVDVLPQILDAMGFRKGLLMGHSDGATIAAIYAGSVEDFRIRGLILMAPHFFTEDSGLQEIRVAKEAFETGDLKARLAKHHRDPDNVFRGWNDVWLHPDFKAWDVAEVIDYFRIPCLAIQGEDDEYGSAAQIDVIDARSYAPVECHLLAKCGHSPHLDQPDLVLDLVGDFTRRLERIEAAQPDVA